MSRGALVAALAAALLAAPRLRAQVPVDSARRVPVIPLPPAPAPDRWFGADKAKHFVIAGMVQGVAFGGATVAGMEGQQALVTSSAITAAVSIGKELYDRRQGRRASFKDLTWDAAGAALWGVLLARSGR